MDVQRLAAPLMARLIATEVPEHAAGAVLLVHGGRSADPGRC